MRRLAGALLLAAAGCGRTTYPAAPIILVTLDTVRADAVSAEAAPVLESLRRESVTFATTIAPSHHTAPSHASILTGFSPDVVRVPNGDTGKMTPIPAAIPTLAEVLRANGYATAAYLDGGNLLAAGGFDRGFDEFVSRPGGILAKERRLRRFLVESKDKPFFLFVHTYRAHGPYQAPADLFDAAAGTYAGKLLEPARRASKLTRAEFLGQAPLVNQLRAENASTPDDRAFLERVYRAGVTATDRELGEFLALLKDTGVYDRAILVVTSDHGESFFEHGRYDHKDVFEETTRVPLAIRLPKGARGGARVDGAFSSLHLMPTILDLLAVKPRVETEGRSCASALFGSRLPDRPIFSAWFLYERRPLGFAVRTDRSKLIDVELTGSAPHFLQSIGAPYFFDLAQDPGEKTNLSGKRPDEELSLRKALEAERGRWDALRRILGTDETGERTLDEEALSELRAIGYAR